MKEHGIPAWGVQPGTVFLSGEGAFLQTSEGGEKERFIDSSSGLVCSNLGHGQKEVITKVANQLQLLAYTAPSEGTPIRAEATRKLVEVLPEGIDQAYITLSGANAGEAAIKAARQYSGRQWILSFERSYHGASRQMMAVSGQDPRKTVEEGETLHIQKLKSPFPYHGRPFGSTEEEIAKNFGDYLDHTIRSHSERDFAGLVFEPVIGSTGVIELPPRLIQTMKRVCGKHGIQLIVDETMSGFGRTGNWFAIEKSGVTPDIIFGAKGASNSLVPSGYMGWARHIKRHFAEEQNTYLHGETYAFHPLSCAAIAATIDFMRNHRVVEEAAAKSELFQEEMTKLKERHLVVKDVSTAGIWGMITFQKDGEGTPAASPVGGTSPLMQEMAKALGDRRIKTMLRGNSQMVAPPLTIKPAELKKMFAQIDAAFREVDPMVVRRS